MMRKSLFITILLLFFVRILLSQNYLANSLWPKFHGDAKQCGSTSAIGPNNPIMLWSINLGQFSVSGLSVSSISPIISPDGTLLISVPTGLFAISKEGNIKWRLPIKGSAIPAIGSDGIIYVLHYSDVLNDSLYAVYPDGTIKWGIPVPSGYGPGHVAIGKDSTIIVVAGGGSKLYTVSYSGTLKWIYDVGVEVSGNATPAIREDGTLYFGGWYGNFLDAIDFEGKRIWRPSINGHVQSGPALGSDGTIYIGTVASIGAKTPSYFYAIDQSGAVKWSSLASGHIRNTPAIDHEGTIYFATQDGKFYSLSSDGTLKWSIGLTNRFWEHSPIIDGKGTVYIGSCDGYLYAINPDGAIRWRYLIAENVELGTPFIDEKGVIYVVAQDGNLYALGNETSPMQFSDQLQLSSDGYRPDIAFDPKSSSVYVVYEGWRDIYPEIFITKSTDNGKTFSSPVPVTKQTAGTIERPAIAVDRLGNIHIVYKDADTYIAYCKSTDGGSTFSSPVRISDTRSSSNDRPSIACFGNNIYVVWGYNETDYRIYFDRSINGASFSTDLQINDITTGTRALPSIAVGSDETIYVTWVDNNKIRFAKSINQGVSFSPSVRVDDNESILPSNRPSITTIGKDTVYVVWEDFRNVNPQVRFSRSVNGGSTFEPSKSVPDTMGNFEQYYPRIKRDENNVIHCVWQDRRNNRNNSDIYYAYLLPDINSFSENIKVNTVPGKISYGHRCPALAISNNNIFVTWEGSTEGVSGWQIYFSKAKFVILPPTIVQYRNNNFPGKFILHQNYPNPFNLTTKIEYHIDNRSQVILKVYDMVGKEVATLVNEEQPPGKYILEFQCEDLPSGIYLYKLKVGENSIIRKMAIIK